MAIGLRLPGGRVLGQPRLLDLAAGSADTQRWNYRAPIARAIGGGAAAYLLELPLPTILALVASMAAGAVILGTIRDAFVGGDRDEPRSTTSPTGNKVAFGLGTFWLFFCSASG